jgi:SAM-dependent methyltransferase
VQPEDVELESVLAEVRAGHDVQDEVFDRIFPRVVRTLSHVNFTPLDVARRAAGLLVPEPGCRVLDVGAGAGKFCLVGALTTEGSFTGIDRSPTLVDVARELAHRFGIPRAHFLLGDVRSESWTSYDSFYLYNPFDIMIGAVSWGFFEDAEQQDCVAFTEATLAERPAGTRVVTFHGFGGLVPKNYERIVAEGQGLDALELWVKRR